MGTRRKSRELVLQMLFQADMGKQTADVVRKTFWAERSNVDEEVRGFADDLFRLASDRLTEIDGLIEKHTQHWRMDRMATVDRNVLREAVAEFLGYPETPRAVVINEALEIARKFSTPESVQFINGVLDSVGRGLGESAAAQGLASSQMHRPTRAESAKPALLRFDRNQIRETRRRVGLVAHAVVGVGVDVGHLLEVSPAQRVDDVHRTAHTRLCWIIVRIRVTGGNEHLASVR